MFKGRSLEAEGMYEVNDRYITPVPGRAPWDFAHSAGLRATLGQDYHCGNISILDYGFNSKLKFSPSMEIKLQLSNNPILRRSKRSFLDSIVEARQVRVSLPQGAISHDKSRKALWL